MQRRLEAILSTGSIASAVLLAIALAGCGSSDPNGTTSANTRPAAKAPTTILLSSPAIQAGKLPARYTCDGADISPPLKWGTVPTGTKELVLFAVDVTSPESRLTGGTVEWTLAGVKPELHELAAGEVPAETNLEQASDGKRDYHVCPPKGQTHRYKFAVYAVPPLFTTGNLITGARLLGNLSTGPGTYRAPGQGEFFASYTRK
jgi:phosphatidylethanolamine-binding protein (PEBP) family uncharacterized protein